MRQFDELGSVNKHFASRRLGASSAMATETLSARVAQLEKTVAELTQSLRPVEPGRDDWKRVVGMFDGDKGMERIIERVTAIRRAERHKADADDHSQYRSLFC